MAEELLHSYRFRSERGESWRELERLLQEVERAGLKALKPEEQLRIPLLYRACVSSLSVARSLSLDANLLQYLESLARRAYFLVYGSRRGFGGLVGNFLVRDFPQAVRQTWLLLALSCFICVLGGVTGWMLTTADSVWFEAFVNRGLAAGRTPEASREYLEETLFANEGSAGAYTFFSSFLFTHNAQVSLLCVSLGALLGLPVVFLMFYNGSVLGAMLAVHTSKGLGIEFTAWLMIHGVTELTAIFLAAGAGFHLARAMIFPRRASRLRALKGAGRTAAVLAVGAIAMLLIAALLEGFGRQLIQDTEVRFMVGFATLILWSFYFVVSGRTPEGPRWSLMDCLARRSREGSA